MPAGPLVSEVKPGNPETLDPKPGSPKSVDSKTVGKVTKIREKGKAAVTAEVKRRGRPPGSKNKPKVTVTGDATKPTAPVNEPTPAAIQHWKATLAQSNALLARAEQAFQIPPLVNPTNNEIAPALQLNDAELTAGAHAFAGVVAASSGNETMAKYGPYVALAVWATFTTVPRVLYLVWLANEKKKAKEEADKAAGVKVLEGGAKK